MSSLEDELARFRSAWRQDLSSQVTAAKPAAAAAAASAKPEFIPPQKHAKPQAPPPQQPRPAAPAAPINPMVQDFLQDLAETDTEQHFDTLPAEVVSLVFRYLPYQTLCRCAVVCRQWSELASDDRLWVALAKQEGLVDASTPLSAKAGRWKDVVRKGILSRDTATRRWKELLATFRQYHSSSGTEAPLIAAAFDADQDVALAGFWDASYLKIFGPGLPESGRVLRRQPFQSVGATTCVAIASNGDLAVSGDSHGRVSISYPGNSLQLFTPQDNEDEEGDGDVGVTALAAAHNGTRNINPPFVRAWHTMMDAPVEKVLFTSLATAVVCMTAGNTVDMLDVVNNGERLVQLQGGLIGMGKERCYSLVARKGYVAYGSSSPMSHRIRVHEDGNGTLKCVLDHRGRPAEVVDIVDVNEVAAGGHRTGVSLYDLRTEAAAQRLGMPNFDIKCLQVQDWRVICGVRDLSTSGHLVVLWDRRQEKQLWSIRCGEPIRNLAFSDSWLVYSSAPSCFHGSLDNPSEGELNGLDFTAPLSELADASCPFSSLYRGVHGYDYNIVLETPYDNVLPWKLG